MFGIIRPINLLLLFAVQFTLWFRLCIPNMTETMLNDFILITISVISAAAAGYIINDIFDVEIDKINKPDKLFVAHKISKKNAFYFYYTLNTISVLAALYTRNYLIFTITKSSILLLYLYSKKLKKTILTGNFCIATLSLLTVLIIYIHFRPQAKEMQFFAYALFAFLTTLAREIVKDKEDSEGDSKMGIQTLANIISNKKIKILLSAINSILLMSLFYFLLNTNENRTISIIFFCFLMVLPSLIMYLIIYNLQSKKDYSNLSKYIKIYMFLGLIWLWI